MKAKIISIVVMLLMACNVMAQDYMMVYFKDRSCRKFYLNDITSIATKKLDADGIQHSDYEFQHITTRNNKYVYNLNEVDSITFTNINEDLEEQHFVDGMSTVMSAITENSLIYDVDFLIYLITQSEAVEDAWSDGNTLNVKIKDNETFSFIINHYHNFVGEYERSAAKIRTMLPEIASASNQTETQLRAVIANQRHKDESSRWEQSAIFDPLIELLESNKIQVDYLEEPTMGFFHSNSVPRISDEDHLNLYDYDLIFLNTPGSYNSVSYLRNEQDANAPYGLKGHSFLTSEDILQIDETDFPISEEDWIAYYWKIKEWRYTLFYPSDVTDQHISIGITYERRDGKPCYVGHPMLTEYFFRDIVPKKTKFLNPNSILFDGASQSLMGEDTDAPSYTLAQQFVQRGLGAFIGYDNISDMGLYAGSSFYNNILSGKSVQKSYEDISEYERNATGNYNNERIVAHLLMYPQNNPSLQHLFLHPTHTTQVSQSNIRAFFESENIVRVEGIAASTNPKSISYGFLYGNNENLSDAVVVDASDAETLTYSMTDWKGNVKFHASLTNLKAGNTYYYCAFTYDGLYYNYGDTLSFYIDKPAEAIDLGLPSGTLWASYNLGATKPEEYGNYYAWGEIEVKEDYHEYTYKYSGNLYSRINIGDDIAGSEYDVAHEKWGDTWEMPSIAHINELLNNCKIDWTKQNGVDGFLATGTNGATVFFPAAGYVGQISYPADAGISALYWSSSINYDFDFYGQYIFRGVSAYAISVDSSHVTWNDGDLFFGHSVRPIKRKIKEHHDNPEYQVAEAIDLGLPSGTMWASWNVGASAPEEYGSYFAWGEIEEKDIYDWSTYTHCNGSTKSCYFIGYDIAGTQYDVAHEKWGDLWQMPTYAQIEELFNNCKVSYTTLNGINGQLLTGPNGAKIFLPAAGGRWENHTDYAGSLGYYWSSTRKKNTFYTTVFNAYNLRFEPDSWGWGTDGEYFSTGFPVRPVQLNPQRTKEYPEPEAIDLGLPSGTKWASWNVGASSPKEIGDYYAWGETEEKTVYDWSTYIHCDGTRSSIHDIGDNIAGTEYDAAHMKWGGAWRMPTYEQIYELLKNCKRRTFPGEGMSFTGLNGDSIFIPITGYRWETTFIGTEVEGIYWSSSINQNETSNAYGLGFTYDWFLRDNFRCDGKPIRAVYPKGPTVSQDLVKLIIGHSTTIEITSGSGNYEISKATTDIVDSRLKGSKITLTALAGGNGVVTLLDKSTGLTVDINVIVSASEFPVAEAIDLGLPSGTKWASWNVGAFAPEQYGSFFAWGELEEKEVYSWDTYIHCDNGYRNKCHYLGDDIAGSEYDVAYIKWGESWRMPSINQIEELFNSCKIEWNNLNGVNGYLFTGPNGNTIFLPAAGYHWDDQINETGRDGYYWSSSLNKETDFRSFDLYFRQTFWYSSSQDRCNGLCVRPVSYSIPTPDITLSKYTVSLSKGSSAAIDITSGSGNYEVSNSNTSVVEATLDGTTITLKGLSGGSAVVTVKDISSGQTATINVNVTSYNYPEPEAIDLGLPSGTKWASWNVGADEPGEYGRHYSWGEIEPFKWNADYKYYDKETKEYIYIGDDISGTDYDVAHVQWGGGWRMPTDEQFQELLDYCSSSYAAVHTTQQTGLGVKNIVVSGLRFVGMNGNSIFLPFVGEYSSTRGFEYEDSVGEYWSSTSRSDLANYGIILAIDWRLHDNPPLLISRRKDVPCSIRAVYCNGLTLSQKRVKLGIGNSTTVKIFVGSGNYELSCSDMSIVEYALHGTTITLTAKAIGDADVIVKDKSSNSSETINVSVFSSDCPAAEAIDLGLPSGTMWASWNVGAFSAEDAGGYYAWGETEEKDVYSWSTYTHGYFNHTVNIGNDISGTKYDVAYEKWGGSWSMPTYEEYEELIKNCTSTLTTQNGMTGMLVTGPNGASIFFPRAGHLTGKYHKSFGACGTYWTSQLYDFDDNEAIYMSFDTSWLLKSRFYFSKMTRDRGCTVRPVLKASLRLSENEVNLTTISSSIINIISGSGRYSVESSNASVATAKILRIGVVITAINAGTAIITVTDTRTHQTAKIDVTATTSNRSEIPGEAIDLGLPSGTKWASWNIGATAPEEYGGYYAWGETEEKDYYDWSTYIHCDGSEETCHKIGNNIAGTEYDVAHVKWGGTWRMPTNDQFKELNQKCTKEWTTRNGMYGMLLTGPNGKSIFLPAAGYRFRDLLRGEYEEGYYWTSSRMVGTSHAYFFEFTSYKRGQNDAYYNRGFSVRPVCP